MLTESLTITYTNHHILCLRGWRVSSMHLYQTPPSCPAMVVYAAGCSHFKHTDSCSSCVDGKHARPPLTSDLLLSSQIASVLIQSAAVAAALRWLVSLVQLFPPVYWKQGCFWFTDTGDVIGLRMNVCIRNHSAAILLSLL